MVHWEQGQLGWKCLSADPVAAEKEALYHATVPGLVIWWAGTDAQGEAPIPRAAEE